MRPRTPAWTLAGPLLGAAGALLLGQDAGYDLRNYHWYVPWALLHGRWGIDLAPAQLQGFLNPLIDLPPYAVTRALGPRAAAAMLGAVQGAMLPLLWSIGACCGLAGREGSAKTGRRGEGRASGAAVALGLAATVGCLGAAGLAVLGTSHGDGVLAVGLLAGLRILLDAAGLSASARPAAAAGLVLGLCVGLKPTAGAFALGAGAALLAAGGAGRVRAGAALCLGGALGWALSGGWWAVLLARRFGNPFFPLANNLFRSPWAPEIAFAETGYLPASPLDAVLRVPRMALGTEVGGLELRDGRLAALAALALAVAVRWGWRRLRGRPLAWTPGTSPAGVPLSGRPERAAATLLLSFVAASWVLWTALSGYPRYGLALEATSPVALLLPLRSLAERRWPGLAVVMLGLVVATTRPLDTMRVPFGDDLLGLQVPPLPPLLPGEERLVVLAGDDALSWVAPDFPGPARFLALSNNLVFHEDDGEVQAAVGRTLASVPGPVWELVGPSGPDPAALASFGLVRGPEPCVPLRWRLDERLELCPVRRSGGRRSQPAM